MSLQAGRFAAVLDDRLQQAESTDGTGGNALKFYASLRLDIRKVGQVKEGDQAVGSRVRVKVVKNKVAAPFREAEFDIRFGFGIDATGELLELAVNHGLIEKVSASYARRGERIGASREPSFLRAALATTRRKLLVALGLTSKTTTDRIRTHIKVLRREFRLTIPSACGGKYCLSKITPAKTDRSQLL